MKRKNLIMHCSLFAGLIGAMAAGDAFSAVRIGNTTRANQYNEQIAEQQRVAQMASVNDIAKISGNAEQKSATTNNRVETSGDAAKLDACSRIYPTGEFEIAQPTAGLGAGGAKTCVAVVELRGYQMGKNGADAVLARANVAAGSTIKCNISDFPESAYLPDAQNVLFPADAEPTVQDVIKVMNQEQKQNAGLKIAAGALIGAVGGNLSGKNDVGKDGLFGTSESQITNTVIGAVGGAAIGAGGAYAGKVGGDVIMSTGINAAAGGVAGNIMAAGDSVLRIEKCKDKDGVESSCLWGYLVTGPTLVQSENIPNALCAVENGTVGECFTYFFNLDDNSTVMRCDVNNKNCGLVNNLVSIRLESDKDAENGEALENLEIQDFARLKNGHTFVIAQSADNSKEMKTGTGNAVESTYKMIVSAKLDTGPKKPVLIKGFYDSAFGKKAEDWRKWKNHPTSDTTIYYRNGDGSIGDDLSTTDSTISLGNFYPMYIDAEDGGIVDLGNKARLKSTLIGAGAGGALGAFTAYQGAQSDIDERWVSAVREYKDSLQKFYCITGSRFLSYYNDTVLIPNINE